MSFLHGYLYVFGMLMWGFSIPEKPVQNCIKEDSFDNLKLVPKSRGQ